LQKAQEENKKLLEKQSKIQEEIDNFKIPNIAELRAVEQLTQDNRFGSFSQLITDIKKQRATPVQIEQYVKTKHNIKPEVLEKTILKLKYPINSNAVEKLENLIKYDKSKLDEIINENEYKALVYNLKKDKLPDITADMENKYKDKFYKLNKLYEQIKDTKKRLDSAVDEILLGNKQKEIVEKVSKKEQDEIIEHFSIDLKHPFNFTRTIDKSQIEHTLKKHGDNVTEEQRGNIAVSKDDIKNYLDIVHSADIKKYGYNDSNKPVVVSGKQVNGYFVVVEEVRTGKSDLAFFTMRKTKGQLRESALMLAKDKLPARRPKSLLSHSESITSQHLKNSNKNDTIDFQALNKFAEPLEKSDSIIKLVNDFKNPIKTPIGELKINMDYMLNKALERDNKARLEVIGYIKPTLQRPAYIINVDNKLHFIKPFIDEKDNTKKFLSVIPNRDNDVTMITSTIIQDRNIQRIVKDGKMIRDFTKEAKAEGLRRLETGSTELAPVPVRADLNSLNPKASNSIGEPMEKSLPSQSLKETEEKALEDISFEELDKKGLIPFANKESLGGGFFGGSEALYNQRDYNNDGKVDEQDIAIGVIGGVIGFKALAKIFPKWFADDIVSNSINSNKLNKEKKNISKVAFGEKPSTIIRTYDENEIINLTKGYHNNAKDKGFGVQHIIVRHMQDDSTGKVSLSELTKIGEVIRDGELSINSNKRVYTLYKDDIRFRAITGENKDTQRVITFYSDRINSTGLGHSAQDYNSATSTTDGIIITYEPKTTFKEWLLDLKNQSKEIKEQNKESIKDFSLKEHGAKRNFGLSEQSTRNSSTNNSSGDTKIGAFVGSKPNEKRTIREQSKKELQEFKEHIKELSQRVHSTRKGLANKEEIKHLGKISLDGIKTLAKNSKEVAKKLNTGVNRNIVTKEALKQNNQNIKRSERRYKNR